MAGLFQTCSNVIATLFRIEYAVHAVLNYPSSTSQPFSQPLAEKLFKLYKINQFPVNVPLQ